MVTPAKYGTPKNPFRGVYDQSPRVSPNYDAGAYSTDIGSLKVARLYLSRDAKDVAFPLLKGNSYAGFFLQQVAEQHSERAEVVQLPGDSYAAYFFGSAPSTYTFSGTFLNTQEDQWRVLFKRLYMGVLRGTENAKQRHLVQIAYDTKIVSGYITGLTDVLKADNELFSSFQFTMLVKAEHLALAESAIEASDRKAFGTDIEDFAKFAKIAESNAASAAKYAVTAYVDVPPKARQRLSSRRSAAPACVPLPLSNAGVYTASGGKTSTAVAGSRKCNEAESRLVYRKKHSALLARARKATGDARKLLEAKADGLNKKLHLESKKNSLKK
jgi:hypothetical protein